MFWDVTKSVTGTAARYISTALQSFKTQETARPIILQNIPETML
jgi:hypothetical protein